MKVHPSGLWLAWKIEFLNRFGVWPWELVFPTGNHDFAAADTDSPAKPQRTPARGKWTNQNQGFF